MSEVEVEDDNPKAEEYITQFEHWTAYQAIGSLALVLDAKHNRYERIVKMNRDIIIESKRIICRLHNIKSDKDESKKCKILSEAEERINKLLTSNFKSIAYELIDEDPYLYHKAFTGGIQEFVEALCFFYYVKDEIIHNIHEIKTKFYYKDDNSGEYFKLLFTPLDYVMGIADFTGEMMRKCITKLGVGEVDDCFKLCRFVREIFTGFLSLPHLRNKSLSRKIYTLKQSLRKMELVCYYISIRGNEIPKNVLINIIETESKDVEETGDERFELSH